MQKFGQAGVPSTAGPGGDVGLGGELSAVLGGQFQERNNMLERWGAEIRLIRPSSTPPSLALWTLGPERSLAGGVLGTRWGRRRLNSFPDPHPLTSPVMTTTDIPSHGPVSPGAELSR